MTNYEKYKDEIIKALFVTGSIGINKETGEFLGCGNLHCDGDCLFGIDTGGMCTLETTQKWLDSAYVESKKEEVDWSKVPIDTPVLVSDDNENWYRRYFAGIDVHTDEDLAWSDDSTSWVNRTTQPWKYIKLYKGDEE
nr:MAG TPA: hypothetical protein [Caudoviricetes sp.]